MLRIEYTNRFKKDVKRLQKRGKAMHKLASVIETLRMKKMLPASCRNHKLTGEWKDFWECHIEPDWLLIYQMHEAALIIAASGSHADMFE